MKRIIIFAVAFGFCFATLNNQANAQTFKKGDKVLNVGIGFGDPYGGWGSYGWETKVPAIHASLDYGIIDKIFGVDKLSLGVGGLVGFKMKGYDFNGYGSRDYTWTYSTFVIGARGTFHYEINKDFEAYGGAMIGFRYVSFDYDDYWEDYYYGWYNSEPDNSDSDFLFDLFVGARYYFTKSIGAFGEVGYANIAYFNLGVSFKF
ncbi:MAG: hypothetical protein LBR28_03430 [Bacteroidales bacterium]|jgi:hypothetical protein|nr:hypothetical protein [Bacteroidales bacterium]